MQSFVIRLLPVSTRSDAERFLYELLQERRPEESISHRRMPSAREHAHFVRNHPYRNWWIIVHDDVPVGAAYVTQAFEVGIGIKRRHQGKGYGKAAVGQIMAMYPKQELLANINPANERSARMFEALGFKMVQHTYRRDR